MALLRSLALVSLAAVSGCAMAFDKTECDIDNDCMKYSMGGSKVYCTSDHLCVDGLPSERLCPEVIGDPNAPGTMVVASLLDRSYELDVNMENAYRLAFDEINPQQPGGMLPPIALVLCHTASDNEQTVRAATVAIEKYHAVALLGPTTSGGVVAINSLITNKGVVVVTPSATATAISSLGDNNLVWRTAPSDALQAQILAKMVKSDTTPPTAVATLAVDTLYGKGLGDEFRRVYIEEVKGPGFKQSFEFKDGAGDLEAQLNELAKIGPSHALLVADADAAKLVSLLSTQQGLSATRFFMGDAAKQTAIFGMQMEVPKAVLDRIQGTAPTTPSGNAFITFSSSYVARFKIDPAGSAFASNAYDAAYLIAMASAVAPGRVPTGAELSQGLSRVGTSGPLIDIARSNYLAAVKAVSDGAVQLAGTSGAIAFDNSGDLRSGKFDVWSVDTSSMPYKFKSMPAQ